MKRLFFLAVVLGTAILTGIFAFSYWRLKTKTPDAYFQLGKTYYDQGKLSDATIEFLNALKRDGNHRDSRYYLALCSLAQKDPASAYRQFTALLDAHPDDVEALLQVGSLYLAGGPSNPENYREAQRTADTILKKDPQNVRALLLASNALVGLKEFVLAQGVFDQALAAEPGNASLWISLGGMRVLQSRMDDGEKAFLKAREVDPKSKAAITSLANFYSITGNPEKAESVFREGLTQFPADRDMYSQVASFYLRNRRFLDAETTLQRAQAANSSDPTPTIDLARILRTQGRTDDAMRVLTEAKAKLKGSVPLSIEIAGFLIPSKLDEARREVDEILKAEPRNPAGHVLLGQLKYASEDYDGAAETLGKPPAYGSPYPQVYFLLGNMALRKGQLDEAQSHFQESLSYERNYLPSLIALTDLFLMKGNVSEARTRISQVLEIDPTNVSARLLKAMADAAEKLPQAEAQFTRLSTEFPDEYKVHRQAGLYFLSTGKYAAAEKSLSRAFELAPSEQSLKELTNLYLATNQMDKARRKLDGVSDKGASYYELVGMVAEHERRSQDAEAAYQMALQKEPNRLSAESLLFNHYLRSERLSDALSLLEGISKRMPSNAMVFAMKGGVNEKQGNLKDAEENYRKALEGNPSIDFAANNLAYLLAETGRDLETAQGLAEGVRRREPQSAIAADTLGWIYYKKDLLGLARAQAEFAVSRESGNGVFQYHLGQIYRKCGRTPRAVEALKKAAGSNKATREKDLAQEDLKALLRGEQEDVKDRASCGA